MPDGSEIKQMQMLCYDGTHKETKWLAVKSKGAVQVFRMFCLDRCLPKDWLSREEGVTFIRGLWWETAWGGCDITNGDIWWLLWVLAGNWLPLGCNPGGTPDIYPSELLRNREGTRANGWMDDHWPDGHSSVSPEDHDTCMLKIIISYKWLPPLQESLRILYDVICICMCVHMCLHL